MTPSCPLVCLEVVEADDPRLDVAEGRRHAALVALVERNAVDRGEQFDAERRHAKPDDLFGLEKELLGQMGRVEAERMKDEDVRGSRPRNRRR
jgi:hypothetical protein